jgi:hypothetical protein
MDAAAAEAEKSKKRARDEDEDEKPELKKPNCSQGASLFNSVPKECIQKNEVALETIIKNAVDVPIELVKKETADGVIALLQSSGNDAIAKILMKEALPQLTGPDGKILDAVITDPAVAKEFDKFQNNLSGVVGKSLTQLSHNIEKPLNNAVETAIEGGISTATHAVANAPGVGAIVTIGEAVGTVNKLKDEAAEIMDDVNKAKLPIDTAMKDILPLSAAIDEAATKAKNAQDAAASGVASATSGVASATDAATSAAASGVASATDAATSAAASGVASATDAATSAAASGVASATDAASSAASSGVANATSATKGAVAGVNDANPNVEPEPEIGKKRGREGGSRKRRRIAKLSRRIERTLRRVQNKYGLKDKNSFLRRTLNAKKMK